MRVRVRVRALLGTRWAWWRASAEGGGACAHPAAPDDAVRADAMPVQDVRDALEVPPEGGEDDARVGLVGEPLEARHQLARPDMRRRAVRLSTPSMSRKMTRVSSALER